MAESIGLASGLLTLATFAFQSSTTLYQTVKSFQSHPKHVRELLEELGALSAVLGGLTEISGNATQGSLVTLDLPLLRCGKACEEFKQELIKCSSRTRDDRTSFRDWAKLRYNGEDIDGFRRQISAYALTINVALTGANFRQSAITEETLQSYRDLIEMATGDVEARLERIDEKLNTIISQAATRSGADATELHRVREEKLSTQRCLEICKNLSEHIAMIQLVPETSNDPSRLASMPTASERIINTGLQECQNNLALTANRLEKHMQEVMNRLAAKSTSALTSSEDLADFARLKDEWETARQCMSICAEANNHLNNNISIIDNFATGDAVQFMVSTDGKPLRGSNRGLGWRTRQVGGHLSDTTVQQLSRDLTTISIRDDKHRPTVAESTKPSDPDSRDNVEISNFRDRYGPGFTLSP